MTYSDSSRRSDHFSYINFFNPSYGLIYMIFQSLSNFLDFFNSEFEFKSRNAITHQKNYLYPAGCLADRDWDQWAQSTAQSAVNGDH